MKHNYASELEDLDDIDGEVDDQWAASVNKTSKGKKVIKSGVVRKAAGVGGDFPGNMPPQLPKGLCAKFGGDPGFFTRCEGSDLKLPEGYDRKAYCAELHKHCTGKWPTQGQHPKRSKQLVFRLAKKR